MKPRAVFIGNQDMMDGTVEPLYNIIAEGHPLHGSTVSRQTLKENNIQFEEKAIKVQKDVCSLCNSKHRSLEDGKFKHNVFRRAGL